MEDDIDEEIMRVWGPDKLPSTAAGGAHRARGSAESDRTAAGMPRAPTRSRDDGMLEAVTYEPFSPIPRAPARWRRRRKAVS